MRHVVDVRQSRRDEDVPLVFDRQDLGTLVESLKDCFATVVLHVFALHFLGLRHAF